MTTSAITFLKTALYNQKRALHVTKQKLLHSTTGTSSALSQSGQAWVRTNLAGELIICSLRSTPTADQVSKVQESGAVLDCMAAKQCIACRLQRVQTKAPLHCAGRVDSCANMEQKLVRTFQKFKLEAS